MTGKYYEDLNVGDRFVTLGRTITETDIVQFLNLIRSLEPQFSDREFYEKSWTFNRLVSPGALTYSIAMGLFTNLGLVSGTAVAFLGMDEFRLPRPVFCGDTIRVELTVVSKRLTSRPDRGIVNLEFLGRNQSEEVVIQWKHANMFACRPAS